MKKAFFFIILFSYFLSGSLYAQEQDTIQGKIIVAMLEEIQKNKDEEYLYILNNLKTPILFVKFMRTKAKTCYNCPTVKEFAKGLSAPPQLPPGVFPTDPVTGLPDKEVKPPPNSNFGAAILEYYQNYLWNEYHQEIEGCSPLYGLNRWGCPIPCQGLCETDPMYPPPPPEEDEEGEEDDQGY